MSFRFGPGVIVAGCHAHQPPSHWNHASSAEAHQQAAMPAFKPGILSKLCYGPAERQVMEQRHLALLITKPDLQKLGLLCIWPAV
eukprot:1160514-Pelagomonas_calceolata.AAC.7